MIRHAGSAAGPLAAWFTSRHCAAGGDCVEIRFLRTVVQVRDSKQISAITGQKDDVSATNEAMKDRRAIRRLVDAGGRRPGWLNPPLSPAPGGSRRSR